MGSGSGLDMDALPWRRQGAGFIGGAIQARLVRAGLLRAYGGLTDRGRRLLDTHSGQ